MIKSIRNTSKTLLRETHDAIPAQGNTCAGALRGISPQRGSRKPCPSGRRTAGPERRAIIAFILILILCGALYEHEHNSVKTIKTGLDTVFIQAKNYIVVKEVDEDYYDYYIFDNNGVPIDIGKNMRTLPIFEKTENGLLRMILHIGTYVNYSHYYDVKKGLISEAILNPIAVRGNVIAYFDSVENKSFLVIRDIFDKESLYCTFPIDTRLTFAPEHAEFISDSEFTITYRTSDLTDVVTKTVEF